MKPKVSVCLITYNQEKYIKDAIDSILMQDCPFEFNLIIGEDCSSDKTRSICIEYANRYPELISLLPEQGHNLGMIDNFVRTLKACDGEYIALCEGDDYWTDKFKLKKQISTLDENPSAIACHHWHEYRYDNSEISHEIVSAPKEGHGYYPKLVSSVEEILQNKLRIKTRTVVYRNIIDDSFFPDSFKKLVFGDVPLSLLMGQFGDFIFIDEVMAVYRQTETGVSTAGKSQMTTLRFHENHMKNWINVWDFSYKLFPANYFDITKTINQFNRDIFGKYPNSIKYWLKLVWFNLIQRRGPLRMRIGSAILIIKNYISNA